MAEDSVGGREFGTGATGKASSGATGKASSGATGKASSGEPENPYTKSRVNQLRFNGALVIDGASMYQSLFPAYLVQEAKDDRDVERLWKTFCENNYEFVKDYRSFRKIKIGNKTEDGKSIPDLEKLDVSFSSYLLPKIVQSEPVKNASDLLRNGRNDISHDCGTGMNDKECDKCFKWLKDRVVSKMFEDFPELKTKWLTHLDQIRHAVIDVDLVKDLKSENETLKKELSIVKKQLEEKEQELKKLQLDKVTPPKVFAERQSRDEKRAPLIPPLRGRRPPTPPPRRLSSTAATFSPSGDEEPISLSSADSQPTPPPLRQQTTATNLPATPPPVPPLRAPPLPSTFASLQNSIPSSSLPRTVAPATTKPTHLTSYEAVVTAAATRPLKTSAAAPPYLPKVAAAPPLPPIQMKTSKRPQSFPSISFGRNAIEFLDQNAQASNWRKLKGLGTVDEWLDSWEELLTRNL